MCFSNVDVCSRNFVCRLLHEWKVQSLKDANESGKNTMFFIRKMKIVLLVSCLLAVISASFAADGDCDAAAEFIFNQAKQEDPSITSYHLDHCTLQHQESYKLMISYKVKNRVTGVVLSRTCLGIVVRVTPYEKDVPRIQIMNKGQCLQS